MIARQGADAPSPPSAPCSETGSLQIWLILTVATLLVVPLLFGAAMIGVRNNTSGTCRPQDLRQPGVAQAAQDGIPATYLRLYQQMGQRYELPWTLLAAIGQVESDHGRDPGSGVRSGANRAGAAGPMQIGIGGKAGNTWGSTPRHPADQHTGGVGIDGDGDGWADVHDPADAIAGAARFLLAHGAPRDTTRAVFAYNHDSAYVHHVLAQAARYAAASPLPVTQANAVPAVCQADLRPAAGDPGTVAAKVIAYARAQLGKPYVYGGTGPDSFDCSGLTMMAYRAAGLTIPRLSDAQYWYGARIRAGTEQPGDLVFFHYLKGHTGPSHVGIVYNPATGTMIVAPHTGARVRLQSYREYPGGPAGFTRPANARPVNRVEGRL
jgi:cell wall-associated NlpC family hydrolase